MALITDAEKNQETPLIELDPFVESDLFLIINAYEKTLRSSETEEGVIISNYGEIQKNKDNVSHWKSISGYYNEASNETSTDGELFLFTKESKADWVPFAECLPCAGRITLGIDNLPHPAMLQINNSYLDAIENFINMMKDLLDPTAFYVDICKLLDALRIVCPQDLIILLSLLQWLLTYYITLSFNIDLDWTSIIALLLLPILLLIQTLLQVSINIGLGPATCLQQLLAASVAIYNEGKEVGLAAKDAYDTSLASVKDFSQETHDLFSEQSDVGPSSTNQPNVQDPSIASNSPTGEEVVVDPIPKGGFTTFQNILGKLSSYDLLRIGVTDINITLGTFLAKFTEAIQTIIDLLGQGLLLRMQFMGAIVQIIRLIGFIKALIQGLTDNSICKDPSVPLSSADISSIIASINGQSSLSGTSNPNGSNTAIVGLNFDLATGNLIIENKLKANSLTVPTCLSAVTDEERAKIQQWIADLEVAS